MFRHVSVALTAVALIALVAKAESFVQPVISASHNLNVESFTLTSHAVTPGCPVAWSVQKSRLHGGKQEGVDVIRVDNDKLQLLIVPTRGMNIVSVTLGDLRLGWDSPVKEIVNPAFINLSSRGGLGWLEGFNENIVRCGLEYNGHPGTDRFVNNVGDEATMDLTLHGRIGNIPASEVEVVVDREAPYRIHVRGRVDERMFYGPKLTIQTDLSTEPGSNTYRIEDVVTNHGPSDQEFELLYHCNYGRPLLEEGSTFLGTIKRITPFNANAAKGTSTYTEYGPPRLGFIEQVYDMVPLAGKDGHAIAMLQNRNRDRAVSLTWSPAELPYFTLWKNTAAEQDGYVTGLEPGTNFPYNRRIERQFGRVPRLAPGGTRHVAIDFAVLVGADAVKEAARRIAEIQGNQQPAIGAAPQAKE